MDTMKKIVVMALLLGTFGTLAAQYTLQPTLPVAGMVQKTQLWNVLAVNSSNNTVNCRLELVLRDRTNGLEQITATSSEFTLSKGARQLSNALLSPIQYNNINTGFVGKGNDQLLPIGNYVACYRLSTISSKPAVLAEECIQLDVEPLSPPMLAFPADSAVLNIQPAQFTWIPPSPQQLFNQLGYEVMIAEILPNQKAEEAIQQNMPFFIELHTPYNLLSYAGNGTAFQKDKWYAWQVVAKDDRSYAAKSEVWVFKVKDSVAQQETVTAAYYPLSRNLAESKTVMVKNGKDLFVQHYSYDREYTGTLTICLAGTDKVLAQQTMTMAYGDNFFSVPLSNAIQKDKTYQLKLTDTQGRSYYLMFKREKQD